MPPASQPVPTRSTQDRVIRANLPPWPATLSADEIRALKSTGLPAVEWLDNTRHVHPKVVDALKQDYSAYRDHQAKWHSAIKPLPTIEAFAAPLLTEAIKQRFNIDLDVRNTYLLDARKFFDHSNSFVEPGFVRDVQHFILRTDYRTLLTAALQNFTPAETKLGALDYDERVRARISPHPDQGGGILYDIRPDQFAALCRELDLGARYQALIDENLQLGSNDQRPGKAAREHLEQRSLLIAAHVALLKGHISMAFYQRIKSAASAPSSRPGITAYSFKLWDVPLKSITAFSDDLDQASGSPAVVVYIPDDPDFPLKEYSSSSAFTRALSERLSQSSYLDFFQRFFPARAHTELRKKIVDRLYPYSIWPWETEGGLNIRKRAVSADVHLREQKFDKPMFAQMLENKVTALKDDALFQAVPTALKDQQAFDERIHHYLAIGMGALNVAAFFVPVLGQAMLLVNVMQLGYETFEGIQAWTLGEQEQAFAYLVDVIENVALIAALGAVGGGSETPAVERIPVETPSFITELEPVDLPDGRTRLWKPDIGPFAHDIVLPASLQPDANGFYHYQGKTWVAIEDKVYLANKGMAQGDYRAGHPSLPDSYEPKLRHNGAGAWQHELDRPLEWQGPRLVRRIAPASRTVTDEMAVRILRVSGTHEAELRRALSENQRPPALLEDTWRRFEADQQALAEYPAGQPDARTNAFERYYRAGSGNPEGGAGMIVQRYPALPEPIAEELAMNATAEESSQLLAGRLPLRIAAEVRVFQQQVRLARAYEGLYLDCPAYNPDSSTLILHSLERLPGWDANVRLEIREDWVGGPLIDSIGPGDSTLRKVLVYREGAFQVLDHEGRQLNGLDDIYSSVLHALPDAQRAALGYPGVWDGPKLKQTLQQGTPLPRYMLRTLLDMQPATPGAHSPMRLANGRIGYPLSGRGAMSGFIARDTLLDMIGLLGGEGMGFSLSAETILTAMEGAYADRAQIYAHLLQMIDEHQALTAAMDTWAEASANMLDPYSPAPARTRISSSIWQCWFANHLPESLSVPRALTLESVPLEQFTLRLPSFLSERVHGLDLLDVTLPPAPGEAAAGVLDRLLNQFPQLTALRMNNSERSLGFSPLSLSLVSQIRTLGPNLQALELVNQDLMIGAYQVEQLQTLDRLVHLDLSGNRLMSNDSLVPLLGMRLDFLGLDRMGFDRFWPYGWPAWLDRAHLAGLRALSLAGNGIIAVPEHILSLNTPSAAPTLIRLNANPLSHSTLSRLYLEWNVPGSPLHFELDMPMTLQAQLLQARAELIALRDQLDNWAGASSSSAPISNEQVASRTRIGQSILRTWHQQVYGDANAPLVLENVRLSDYPRQLSAFSDSRIRNLQLVQVEASQAMLDDFLARFTNLAELRLQGHVQPLSSLPQSLLHLPELRDLSLIDQGLLIDQPAMALLGQVRSLGSLDLSLNRIGPISDTSVMPRYLNMLYLRGTQLHAWPDWVESLLPLSVLDLDNNQITHLPDHILENPRSSEAFTEISLLGNPLDRQTMIDARRSERYGAAYSFHMELPEDLIEEIERNSDSDLSDPSSSDNGSNSSGSDQDSPQPPMALDTPDVDAWLQGTDEQNAAWRSLWARLASDDNGGNLIRLMGRLTSTSPYRNAGLRAEMVRRAWAVLEAADNDVQLRGLLNGLAQEALIQADGSQTCHDGAWLVFSQLEQQVLIRSVNQLPEATRGQEIYRIARAQFRLHALDEFARAHLNDYRRGSPYHTQGDEAEVRLAYRLRLANELDLPLPPGGMRYEAMAQVSPQERQAVLDFVRRGENGEAWLDYAGQRDFWIDYLRSAYPQRFADLEDTYKAQVLALPEASPELPVAALGEEFAALEREYQFQVQRLIRELTILEGRHHQQR